MKTLKPKPEYLSATLALSPDPAKFDFFPRPELVTRVELLCTEVTSLCPITHQPDYSTVKLTYSPDKLCLETKSLKEYLFTYRNYGNFCESMSTKIINDLFPLLQPHLLHVKVEFTSRGGITITSFSYKEKDHDKV